MKEAGLPRKLMRTGSFAASMTDYSRKPACREALPPALRPGGDGGVRFIPFGSLHLTLLALSILCLITPGCATAPVLVPDNTDPSAYGILMAGGPSAQGVTLVGIPDEWRYSPKNLPQHVTPVRVKVTNNRTEAILLTLEDAALIDGRGVRHPAIPPGDAVQRIARAGGDGAYSGSGPRSGISISQGISIGSVGISIGGIGLGGGPRRGPSLGGADTMDALRVGLRPGRLDPGASVEGYLFFDPPLKASDREQRFRFAWRIRPLTPVGAPLAPPLATLEVPFIAR